MEEFKDFIKQFNSDETTNNISILKDKLDNFDINKEIIPSLILKIINDFNNYLNKININNKDDKNNLMITLLYIFIKIYNSLSDKNNYKTFVSVIEKIPNKISSNLESIIVCFHYIHENHKEIFLSNSVLTYYFIYLIYKCILIYYTYNIYIQNIKTIIITNVLKIIYSEDYSAEMEPIYFDTLSSFILGKYKCTSKIENPDCMHIEIIYKAIINKFIIDILGSPNEKDSDTISINLIYSKMKYILNTFIKDIDDIKKITLEKGFICDKFTDTDSGLILDKYIKEPMEDYKRNIYKYIIKNYNLLKSVSNNVQNDYITIPQYTGICWFSAMLTGMCYSDASRNLINSKINSITTSENNKSDQLFIDIVKKILEVSTIFLRYDKNLSTHCDLFKFFKYKLTEYLMAKLNEVKIKIEKENNGNYTKQLLLIGDNEYYYINKLNMILEDTNEDINKEIKKGNNITKIDNMGITSDALFILELLYNILDINALFIISGEKGMFKKKTYTIDKIPEIIIVETIANHEESDLIENIEILKDIQTTEDGFIYKNHIYKLDYMLYSANSKNNVCTKEGCGHCVSSIHYNGEQYYYNSGYSRTTIEHNGECGDYIRIPCSLIRQDWVNSSINNDDKQYFYMNECFYREADITLDSIKIEYKVEDESSALFSKINNVVCVYVKVGKVTEGGKNIIYKSTHKKVNIMNKNKTIIERIVYIDNNKNKYIKFNKKYESLSNFKYNRKNKYYYI